MSNKVTPLPLIPKLKRLVAVLLWFFFAYATFLSLNSNSNPQWYDYASAGPLLLVLIALMLGKNQFLIDELEGWLAKLNSKG